MSNNKEYDFGVFLGRFAPVHGYVSDDPKTINGHVKVMMEALEKCDKLIVVIGSDNIARNTRTPFTAQERANMIAVATNYDPRILITSVGDYDYNDEKWLAEVQKAVDNVINIVDTGSKHKIALCGMHKDDTSYYLKMFPQWANSVAVQPGSDAGEIISATGIRNELFNGNIDYCKHIHPDIRNAIKHEFENNPEFQRLQGDWNYEQKYEAIYGKGPHVTVDSIVVQAGHMLLIRRGQEYGHGLWAMPGGFVNRREKITDAAIRELIEETRIKVPQKVLRGSIVDRRVFDNPYRSNRSHIITHVHKIVLENVGPLPDVKGSDDAEKAKWIPLAEVENMIKNRMFFEDHGSIINVMMGLEG